MICLILQIRKEENKYFEKIPLVQSIPPGNREKAGCFLATAFEVFQNKKVE